MKKLILSVVMLMGTSAATFANDDMYFTNLVETDLSIKTIEGLKFKVTAANLLRKSVVEVKDADGNTLYKEILGAEGFTKVFNFSSLQDGKYKIVLTSGEKTVEKAFEIQTEVTRVAAAK